MRKLELDGLRTLAVLGVIYSHTWSADTRFGELGVRLFLVLSGFLITRILLQARTDYSHEGASRWVAMGIFYLRRALRIWPVYFLMLLALAAVLPAVRSSLLWHIFFLSNVLFAVEGNFSPVIAHLWTLAVEEQFYLFWPFVVFFMPLRLLAPICFVTIFAAPVWRLVGLLSGLPEIVFWMLPPENFDALAAGSLVAYFSSKAISKSRLFGVATLSAGATAAMWMILEAVPVSAPARLDWQYYLQGSLLLTLVLLPMMTAIALADQRAMGLLGRLLSWRPISFVGQVSYGVYLFHLPITNALENASKLGWTDMGEGPACFLLTCLVSILVASMSWVLIERPINLLGPRLR